MLTTLIHTRQAFHRTNLLENVNLLNPALVERLNAYVHNFMSKGKSLTDATTMAYKALEGGIVRQTLLLTYDDAYWLSGMVMLFSIPLIFFQPFRKKLKPVADSH